MYAENILQFMSINAGLLSLYAECSNRANWFKFTEIMSKTASRRLSRWIYRVIYFFQVVGFSVKIQKLFRESRVILLTKGVR